MTTATEVSGDDCYRRIGEVLHGQQPREGARALPARVRLGSLVTHVEGCSFVCYTCRVAGSRLQ